MDTFLRTVALRIRHEHPNDMEKVLVVFNNRRAGLFLKHEMQHLGGRPFFLPHIIGIDQFINELGNLKITPHEFLLFELFDIHRNMKGVERRFETFEEFMPFGEMMINDFSEIDLYRVDPLQLFSNLHELKCIGEWDVSGKPLSPFQEKYLNFYHSLKDYYSELRQRLSQRGQAYSGMAYRHVAENIEPLSEKISYSHIYFVGFNALSDCERCIFEHLVRTGRASMVCDGDAYYFDDTMQEAGHFLRLNARKFPPQEPYPNHFTLKDKKIHILNCPENVLQAKVAGQLLQQEIQQKIKPGESCAIMLAEENLLLPMLNSLPGDISGVNVTMGFPYTLTAVHNLVASLMSLYTHARKQGFYHQDLTAFFSSQLVDTLLGFKNLHTAIYKQIYKQKIIYASRDDIANMLKGVPHSDKLLYLFDETSPSVEQLLGLVRRTAMEIDSCKTLANNIKEKEALACLVEILNYLEELQNPYNYITRIETLQRIYLRIAQRRSVAFYGEPLNGIQMLGMLETRSLDFNKLIILSLNEGIMPAGRSENSLIPFALKKRFGIPTYEEKDAVYAYNFYRLLQRSDEVWLLYSSDSEGMGKGEPSRFIMQLKDEMACRLHNIKVNETTVAAQNCHADSKEITSHEKDSVIQKRLKEMAKEGFSPSALNRYRNCPMQFYYQDVLCLNEQKTINEKLETNELGTFIHLLLQNIYKPCIDTLVKKEHLEKALADTDGMVDGQFQELVLKGRDAEGKNHLYGEVAKMQVKAFLQKEINTLNEGHTIKIKQLEEQLSVSLDMNDDSIDYPVNISGIADRVDFFDGQLRVVDYKSGSVKASDLQVKTLKPSPYDVPDKWFQVMTYAWQYCRQKEYQGDLSAGIFPLRTLSSDFLPAQWGNTKLFSKTNIDQFEALMRELLSELLDKKRPFEAKKDRQNCLFCPFKPLCDQQ